MSTNNKHCVDKFAAALARKPPPTVPAEQPPTVPAAPSPRGADITTGAAKATFLQPILCVECPACHSRVHPRVRTFERADGYDVVRGMCPNCRGVYWVFNREQEQFTAPAGSPSRNPVRYVYKP